MPLKGKSEEDPTSPLPNFTFETRASQTKWAGELLKGCCEEAESLKLYASQLVLVLDGNVMLLGAFDELVDLKNSLATLVWLVEVHGSSPPRTHGRRPREEASLSVAEPLAHAGHLNLTSTS